MVAEHEIFHRPFDARAVESESIETPPHYLTMPGGEKLGSRMNVWRVHADPLTPKNFGLVADGYGFDDSPDAEFIAGGVNSKGPRAVAIGRQGNYLHWGFCATPGQMTPGARLAFLNAVVYMKRFDGAPIIVTAPYPAREKAFVFASVWKSSPQFAFASEKFDAALLKEAGDDPERLLEILAERRDFIRADRVVKTETRDGETVSYDDFVFSIDEDARAFGVPPHEARIVDTCFNMIAHREEVERAHRILVKSIGRDLGGDFAFWKRFWAEHSARAFWSERGGYRFVIVDPATAAALERLKKIEAGGK